MIRILSYIKFKRRLRLCLLISLPALLAEPALTSPPNYTAEAVKTEQRHLSTQQIKQQLSLTSTREQVSSIANRLSTAASAEATQIIRELLETPALAATQKEAVLFSLTQHLRNRRATPADKAFMTQLTQYQSQVFTGHHDDPRIAQPAFNIAAGAQGALYEWRYQDIADTVARSNSAAFMQLWQSASAADQAHILRSLRHASVADLRELHATAMQHYTDHPELAAATAIASKDVTALTQLLATAPAATASQALMQTSNADAGFSAAQRQTILQATLEHSDSAIAALATQLLVQSAPEAAGLRARLIEQLNDPEMGVSAAMGLAKLLNATDIAELNALADPADELLQARLLLIQQLRSEAE